MWLGSVLVALVVCLSKTDVTVPLTGLRITRGALGLGKWKRLPRDPARASADASPTRPVRQLSSMNFVTEAWSVWVWSTKFVLA